MFVVCTSMIAMAVFTLRDSQQTYDAAMRQRTGLQLASELAGDGRALVQVLDDETAANALLSRVARINPQIALYLLDRNGDILASSNPESLARLRHVNIAPLERVLAGEQALPIMGDDPRDPAQPKVFSAAAVPPQGPARAFLYVVLPDEGRAQGTPWLTGSYVFRQGAVLFACWAALMLLAGLVVAAFVTRPLQRLTVAMERFQGKDFSAESIPPEASLPTSGDEIGRLAQGFSAMAKRIGQQMQDLRKHDTARRELFANISHDLRTPLASLLGYLETISLKRNLSEEEKKRYCDIAMQEARHVTNLVDKLLELATLDAPEAKTAPEVFMLSELVETICREFALVASEKGVALIKEFSSSRSIPPVLADPALIERALENLVDNALRHTPTGGAVSIALSRELSGVGVSVSDTGTGIAPEDLPRIFDRFYRGEKDRRRASSSGAGLGLPIAKRILELHGASLQVESRVGAFTRFYFRLPLAGPAEAPIGPTASTGKDTPR